MEGLELSASTTLCPRLIILVMRRLRRTQHRRRPVRLRPRLRPLDPLQLLHAPLSLAPTSPGSLLEVQGVEQASNQKTDRRSALMDERTLTDADITAIIAAMRCAAPAQTGADD